MRRKLTALAAVAVIAAGPGVADAATGPAAGTSWTTQHVPLPAGAKNASPGAVSCASASDCELVGFYVKSDVGDPLAENWNGHAWSAQAVPNPSGGQWTQLEGLSCASATRCVAVGTYEKGSGVGVQGMVAEQWDGSTWAAQTSFPLPAGGQGQFLQGVWCVTASSCTAVGSYYATNRARHPVAEHWNGHAWSLQAVPDPGKSQNSYLDGIACTSADSCMATGYYFTTGADGTGKPITAQWNGHTWALLRTPLPADSVGGGALESVSCASATNCTAVGSYLDKGSYDLAEHWNGSAWTVQHTPSPGAGSSPEDGLNSVSCVSASSCTAVGLASDVSAMNLRPQAEYWNGSTWAVQKTATPQADEFLAGVACNAATACTAVGGTPADHGTHDLPVAEHS
ncbi:MAG TPA: hypothetical protein VGH27_18585 [Streptosporangiaceae bacterium]|jgi:hypothetical protein